MMLFKKNIQKTDAERLAERREKVLARGNKFRYPMQFSRKNIMLATVIIGLFAMVSVTGILAWNLYRGQNTGDMMFRLTKILPIPVAKVDGASVKFMDYLLIYRSSLVPIEKHGGQVGGGQDAEAIRTYYKRSALTGAEDLTYALKLAKELEVKVGEDDMKKEWEKQRKIGGVERSEESFLKVLKDNFELEKSEYMRIMYLNLVKAKVMEKIDEEAKEVAIKVEELIKTKNGDFRAIVDELGEKVGYEETGGFVPKMNVDGGRAVKAAELELNAISEKFLSNNGDGYYFVKTLEKNEKEVNYVSIKIPFKEFDKRITELRAKEKGVVEYIKL